MTVENASTRRAWFGYIPEALVLKQFLLTVSASEGTCAGSCMSSEEDENAEGATAGPGMGNPTETAQWALGW